MSTQLLDLTQSEEKMCDNLNQEDLPTLLQQARLLIIDLSLEIANKEDTETYLRGKIAELEKQLAYPMDLD